MKLVKALIWPVITYGAEDEVGESAHMASDYIRSRRLDFKEI